MKRILKLLPMVAIGMFVAACGPSYQNVAPHSSGWSAPSLSAPDQYGRKVNISQATGGPWALVFFYPKADTPG